MTGRNTRLGDSHNFGRRVSVGRVRVAKPRTLLWEWLVLAGESPLRRALQTAAREDGLAKDVFGFLPTLKFFSGPSRDHVGGEVERIALRPLPSASPAMRRELAAVVGRSLGLWSWLGASDLHWENLALGLDARGRVVFGPLDVEMILADLSLPTETKLLPDADPEYAAICRHACGVRRVLPYLGKPVDAALLLAMAGAYRSTLVFLDRHGETLARALKRVPGLRDAPIRICLRGTDAYMRARSTPVWPPLLDAEEEQLERGDVPYFFRLYGRPGIHYYADPSLRALKRLPLTGDVPRLDPILRLSRGLRSPSRSKLMNEGLFALLGAFDHPSIQGGHDGDDLSATFGKRTIVVRLPGGEELVSRRDVSAFVGSVYLPCRCGEVRSVLVPKVTRCAITSKARGHFDL